MIKLFCKHDYKQIDFYAAETVDGSLRYSTRIYKCQKCGKEIEVDGRKDWIRK